MKSLNFLLVILAAVPSILLAAPPASPASQAQTRILEWADPGPVARPRLLIEPGRPELFQERLRQRTESAEFATFPPTGHYNTAGLLLMATGLDSAGADLASQDGPSNRLIAAFSNRPGRPDAQSVVNDLLLVDWLLAWPRVPPELEQRLRRVLATIGYELAEPNGRRPGLALGSTPAQKGLAEAWNAVALEMVAELIPTHPSADRWRLMAAARLTDFALPELPADGRFVPITPALLAPRLLHEALPSRRRSINPPDARLRGLLLSLARRATAHDAVRGSRTLMGSPGNGPRGTCIFGWAAGVYAQRDPAFAAEMAWWHQQFGEPADSDFGLRGVIAESALATLQLLSRAPPAVTPKLVTETVAGFGMVIRGDAPSPGELYVAVPDSPLPQLSYYHQAFPVAQMRWQSGRVGNEPVAPGAKPPAEPPSPEAPPDIPSPLVTDFAEYVSVNRDNVRQEVLTIRSPVLAAAQYVVVRWVPPTGEAGLHLELPGDTFKLADGQFENSYDELGVAVTVRLLTPTAGPIAKSTVLPTLDRGMPWHRVVLPLVPDAPMTAVVFPFQAGFPRPQIQPIADGAGAEIQSRNSTHWVFLSDRPVKFESVNADFEGRAGAVREAPAVRSIQIFGGGRARTQDWSVSTNGTLHILQRGPRTLQLQTDGPEQRVQVTWKRIGRVRPEVTLFPEKGDEQLLSASHDEETTSFTVPAGRHTVRLDFER